MGTGLCVCVCVCYTEMPTLFRGKKSIPPNVNLRSFFPNDCPSALHLPQAVERRTSTAQTPMEPLCHVQSAGQETSMLRQWPSGPPAVETFARAYSELLLWNFLPLHWGSCETLLWFSWSSRQIFVDTSHVPIILLSAESTTGTYRTRVISFKVQAGHWQCKCPGLAWEAHKRDGTQAVSRYGTALSCKGQFLPCSPPHSNTSTGWASPPSS